MALRIAGYNAVRSYTERTKSSSETQIHLGHDALGLTNVHVCLHIARAELECGAAERCER